MWFSGSFSVDIGSLAREAQRSKRECGSQSDRAPFPLPFPGGELHGWGRWMGESRPDQEQAAKGSLDFLISHVTPGKSLNLLFWKNGIVIPIQFAFQGVLGRNR